MNPFISLRRSVLAVSLGLLIAVLLTALPGHSMPDRDPKETRSWPMFGGSPSRNMVNPFEKNLPAAWSVEEGKRKNIKWVAELGGRTVFGSPMVADGKIFVSCSNGKPNDARAVLKAFREKDGKLLWQIEHVYPNDPVFNLAQSEGLVSTPAFDTKRLYYVTPACEVICADIEVGKVLWRYDLMKELKVVPLYCNISSPLVYGDHVFVTTGNGRDEEGKLPAPKAPSFVALNKKTGKLVWQSNLPGDRIIEGQWSSPTLGVVKDVPQIIFAGGDGVIYSFEPATGKLIWKCDCLPARQKPNQRDIDSYFVATPVTVGDRLYIGLGVHPDNSRATRSSYFLCLDITKKGDVSLKSYDKNAFENRNSALVWSFGGLVDPAPPKGRKTNLGPIFSTAAVHDGLVYIPEEAGYLHCLDAATGRRYWVHDLKTGVWGSAYWVDGRVFLGTQDGEVLVFAHGRTESLLTTIDMEEVIQTTPVAANGVLYVTTRTKLYAIGKR